MDTALETRGRQDRSTREGTVSPRRGWLGAAAAGAALVITIVPALLRPQNFLADDAYFYLEIGRNLAAGLGSTFNGITTTNGYHPLWALVCAGAALLTGGHKPWLVRAIILVQILLFLGIVRLFSSCCARLRLPSPRIGVPLLALFFLTGQFGSEAALNCLAVVLAVWCVLWAWRSPSCGRAAAVGAALGLSILARIDNVLIAPSLLAILALHREPDRPLWSLRRVAVLFVPALVALAAVAAPYFAVNLANWDHALPVSAQIKTWFPTMVWRPRQLGTPGAVILAGVACTLALSGCRWTRDRRPVRLVLGALASGSLAQIAYIVVFLKGSAWGWYLVPGAVAIAFGLVAARQWLAEHPFRRLGYLAAVPAALAVGLALFTVARGWIRYTDPGVAGLYSTWFAGHRPPPVRWQIRLALELKASLPASTRLAVSDAAGMISWYSGLPTFGLDGLVADPWFGDEITRLGPAEYFRVKGITAYAGPLAAGSDGGQSIVIDRPIDHRPAGRLTLRRDDLVFVAQYPGGPEWGVWGLGTNRGASPADAPGAR